MTARRLLEVDRRETERRRDATYGMARLLVMPWATPLWMGGLAGIVLLLVRFLVDPLEARAWWLALAVIATATMVLRGPWRLFWRPDATLLARLPIAGRSLYRRAAAHDARLGLEVALALSVAALPWVEPLSWLRSVAVIFVVVASAVGMAAAAATTGGALFASKKTETLVSAMSGESAPSIAWLTILPSVGAMYVGLLWFLFWPFATHAMSATPIAPMALLIPGALLLAVAVYVAGEFLASRTLALATREVAALDAVRLAHVDLESPRTLESAWGRHALGATARVASVFYRKDISLARRRYPAFFLVSGLGIVIEWIMALALGHTRESWIIGMSFGLGAYAALLGSRLMAEPIERLRLVATLPIPTPSIVRAKRAYVVWRSTWPIILGALPSILRSRSPATLALVVLAILLLGTGVGVWMCRVKHCADPG